MKEKIIIEQVKKEWLEEVYMVEKACFPENEAASLAQIYERYERFSSHFYVAKKCDRIAGLINGAVIDKPYIDLWMYENTDCHDENGDYQAVFSVAVLEEFRHAGIAHQMMEQFVKQAKLEKRKGMTLTCLDHNVLLYQSMGFRWSKIVARIEGSENWNNMFFPFGTEYDTRWTNGIDGEK